MTRLQTFAAIFLGLLFGAGAMGAGLSWILGLFRETALHAPGFHQ